jgi:hypothetical protein
LKHASVKDGGFGTVRVAGTATAPVRLAGSVRLAKSLMPLPTVAADYSARRSTTMPAWLPGR